MAHSSVASTSVPSSPLSERSGSSRQTRASDNTTAPLLTGNNRHFGQTHSVGGQGVEGGVTPEPAAQPWSPTDVNEGAPRGWPQLAKFMARRRTLQSFPRFHEANVKNLLYYQVQIAKLEKELKEQERDDWNRNIHMEKRHWFACHPDMMVRAEDCQQWKLVLELRKCLHQYNRALIEFAEVSAMPEPSNVNVRTLFEWLTDRDLGNCQVNGSGKNVWGNQDDDPVPQHPSKLFRDLLRSIFVFWKDPPARTNANLVVPRRDHTVDGLTSWVADIWTPFWFAFKQHWVARWNNENQDGELGPPGSGKQAKRGEENRFETHSEKSMLRFTSAVATVVACLLPTLAISILTTARGMTETLLYIGGFTALFAIGLMILATDTSRVQIFTATAAFSAVLVVFVQGQ